MSLHRFHRIFRHLRLGRCATPAGRRPHPGTRLGLESLEDRRLLSHLPFADLPEFWQSTSEFMLGDVQVTVVLLESNGSIDADTENWTAEQKAQVKTEIGAGLEWWKQTLAGYGSVHSLDFRVDFAYADAPVPTSYEPINRPAGPGGDEALWVNDFLGFVGYNTAAGYLDDVRRFTHDRRVASDTHWAITIFVVNSANDPDGRFAGSSQEFDIGYGYIGGPFTVVTYDSGDGGIAAMRSGIATLTGANFYALGEAEIHSNLYTDRSGYYDTQNLNAFHGNPDPTQRVPSIMADLDLLDRAWTNHVTSPTSAAMIGWQDSDGDRVFDVLDVPLMLTGSGSFNPATGFYEFVGSSHVQILENRNPRGPGQDLTINSVDRAEYRVDGGPWVPDAAFGTPIASLDLELGPFLLGPHTIDIRTVDSDTGITSQMFSDSFWATCGILQLTHDGTAKASPVIDAGQVVWSAYDGNDTDLFLYDGDSIRRLTDTPDISEGDPDIDAGQIVWVGIEGHNKYIYFFDGSVVRKLTDTPVAGSLVTVLPRIDNGQAVWNAANGGEIFFYDGSAVRQLTNDGTPKSSPDIDDGQVVWSAYDPADDDSEIYFYDGTEIQRVTDNTWLDNPPAHIDNGQIVWHSNRDRHDRFTEILLYDGSVIRQLTNNTVADLWPQIDSGQVVWTRSSGSGGEIYLYDGNSTWLLAEGDIISHARLNEGRAYWLEGDGDKAFIVLYDGSRVRRFWRFSQWALEQSEKITDEHGNVAWSDYVDGQTEIFLYPRCSSDLKALQTAADGVSTLTVTYEVAHDSASPFEIGFYLSTDPLHDAGDQLLSMVQINDPAALTRGLHTRTLAIGSGPDEIALPGAGGPFPSSDYHLLAVMDPTNVLAEPDSDPLNEDNTAIVSGIYRTAGGDLLISAEPVDDRIVLAPGSIQIDINGNVFQYNRSDVSALQIRALGGNDTVEGSQIDAPLHVWGGEGDDELVGGHASDELAGGPGHDRLEGHGGDDTLRGDAGHDVLLGGAGQNVLLGGDGDDLHLLPAANFQRVDGGPGHDVLQFTGQNLDLDLTAVADGGLAGLEEIDISGSGANTLSVAAQEVLDISDTSDTLTVRSNADDQVDLDERWVFAGTEVVDNEFFRVFGQGSATLRLSGPRNWQNPVDGLDVNGNAFVVPFDILFIINLLNSPNPDVIDATGRLQDAAQVAPHDFFFYDVDGNGFATHFDALRVVNFLNAQTSPEGEESRSAAEHPLAAAHAALQPPGPVGIPIPVSIPLLYTPRRPLPPRTLPLAGRLDRSPSPAESAASRRAPPPPAFPTTHHPPRLALRSVSERVLGSTELEDVLAAIAADIARYGREGAPSGGTTLEVLAQAG